MTTVLMILLLGVYLLLVVVRAMRPPRSTLSNYELERRAAAGDGDAQAVHRKRLLPKVMILHRLWEFILIAAMALLAVAAFGWLGGVATALVLLLLVGVLARLTLVVKLAHRCWKQHEAALAKIAKKYPHYVMMFRGLGDAEASGTFQLHSREELLNIIERAGDAIDKAEKQLLEKALAFGHRHISEVMTPRKEVVSITKDEVLGPLTLTALHKIGHSHLPVVHGGLDRIIGILAASEFMNTERQGEVTVEDAMRRQIFYLNESQTLQEALQALLHTKAHLFIVVDKYEKTVGIITISDVIEALFGRASNGRKYQQYEDVHAVAKLSATSSQTSD